MVESMAGSDRPCVGRTADQAPGAEGGGRTQAGVAAAGGRCGGGEEALALSQTVSWLCHLPAV